MKVLGDITGGVKSIIKGLGVTISYLFRRKVTIQYPEQRPELSQRFRGIPALPVDPATGKDRCIACSACARVCPVAVISIVQGVGEDKKRYPEQFTLDSSRCIFCGLCAEVCPTHAIVMSHEFELAQTSREGMVLDLEKLHDLGGVFDTPQEPRGKPAAPAATSTTPSAAPDPQKPGLEEPGDQEKASAEKSSGSPPPDQKPQEAATEDSSTESKEPGGDK